MSQGQLGAEANIERSALNKIEKGTRRVSAFELSELARVLRLRMDWFVQDPTPAIVARRQREGTSGRTTDVELERITREVEFVHALAGVPGFTRLDKFDAPENGVAAENLAEEVRRRMGIEPAEPIRDLVSAVEEVGLFAFSEELGPDAADGASVLLHDGGVALVNSTNDVGRRRLALAHELGHYVLADDYTVDQSVLHRSDSGREALVDRFGRSFLAPAGAFREFWSQEAGHGLETRIVVLKAASHFRIDLATVARRMTELGMADEESSDAIRGIRALKSDFIEHNLHVPGDMAGATVPRSFAIAVIALYKAEKITQERALELLRNFTEADLPPRPLRNEAEIWQFIS